MANSYYPPDPYNGWRNLDSSGNYPASRIMTDTSGQWQCVYYSSFLRIYQQR